MGLDIQKLIAAAEAKVYGDNKGADGKLNTDKEISVFSDLLKKEVANEQEFNEIMGLALGNGASTTRSPKKASGGDNGNGGTGSIIINVDNSTTITINITINTNVDEAVKQLMEQIANMEANWDSVFSQFATQLFAVLGGDLGEIMQQILASIQDLKQGQEETNNKLDSMYKGLMDAMKAQFNILNRLKLNSDEILKALQESNLKQDQQLELLSEIYDAIMGLKDEAGNFSAEMKAMFNDIMALLKDGKVQLGDITALLKAIQNDVSDNKEISKEILEVVKGFRADFDNFTEVQKEQFNQVIQLLKDGAVDTESILALLNAIKNNTDEGNEKLDAILAAIKDFRADFDNLSEAQQKNFNEVMNLIKGINVSGGGTVSVDLTEIVDLLKAIKEDTSEGNKIATEILKAIKDFKADFDNFTVEQKEQYNTLLQLLNAGEVALDDVVALLNAIKNTSEENVEVSKEILEVVKGIRADFNNFTEVEQEQFNALMQLLKDNSKDTESILELLKAIKTLNEAANGKLDTVIENQDTIISLIENFKVSIEALIKDNAKAQENWGNAVINILNDILAKIGNGCKVDAEALMEMLQKILDKCGCNCHCGDKEDPGKDHNEGIDDDYNDLLGSAAKAKSFILGDDEADTITDVRGDNANGRDGKFVDPATGKVVIRKNGKVYDVNGRPIR